MILRKFPLNFAVFFHIAINKNICGAGKKQTSLQRVTNRLLDPEPSKYSSAKSSLYLDNGKYYKIIYGINPVPENNLAAVKKCNLFKLAENIISIRLKDEEESVRCIASLLNADLLYFMDAQDKNETDRTKYKLLEDFKTDHIQLAINFKHVIDYLQSKGDGNKTIRNAILELLRSNHDPISNNPFDLLKWTVNFFRTIPQKIDGSQAVVDDIIGIIRKEIYPTLHIVESMKNAQDIANNVYEKNKINRFFDDLYYTYTDNGLERQITNEQMLNELDALADYFLDSDSKLDSERDRIYRKANAVICLAYVLQSIASFYSGEKCMPNDKKTDLRKDNANSKTLEMYKTMASKLNPMCLKDHVGNVRSLGVKKDIDYATFLLLALKYYDYDSSIYKREMFTGIRKRSKDFGLYEFDSEDFFWRIIHSLYEKNVFILQGKGIMPESFQVVGDRASIENELYTIVAAWEANSTY